MIRPRRFADRSEAGRRLVGLLGHLAPERPVVLALPRGGVPVGAEVARGLSAPLDVLIVRKIGHPAQPELGVGAVGEEDALVLNRELLDRSGLTDPDLAPTIDLERAEVARRAETYRSGAAPLSLLDRTAIVVDDGLATGYTARAAVAIVRHRGARRVILAVGVAPPSTVVELRDVPGRSGVDEVVAVFEPRRMGSVGEWYADFHQLSDQEVRVILES